MEEASWSDLPQSLLEEIVSRLARRQYLIFGSVCSSWRMAQTQCDYPPAAPLPIIIYYFDEKCVRYFSPSKKKSLTAPLHNGLTPIGNGFFHGRFLSSSHGWLLMETKNDFGSEPMFHLFNPFVKKYCNDHFQNHIQLPKTKGVVCYLHCVFFSTPSDPDGVLFVTSSDNSFLLYRLRLNNRYDRYQWERDRYRYQWEGSGVISNFIFCKGKLYALKKDWSLAVIYPRSPIIVTSVRMEKYLFPPPVKSHFLVESCGEILMVTTSFWSIDMASDMRVHVSRADMIKMEWVKVENLGNRTMFLSSASSFSVCAPEMGIKSNSIYYSFIGIKCKTDWEKYGEVELASDGTLRGERDPYGIRGFAWVLSCLP
ncbi:hypothetical protein MRB53_015618 [Persea americana]|uniref:Uncharacterized protein n=1 Tax=Persea americana TaxID=3435 RepID=A0ACC2M0U7_PERAE|nr:hypothetical protein MRB53_015618 [Persea americana]